MCILERDARSATFLFALLPLFARFSCFFPPPFLFLDKKRKSLPAYLEAMRYTDAGRAPERKHASIPINPAVATDKHRLIKKKLYEVLKNVTCEIRKLSLFLFVKFFNSNLFLQAAGKIVHVLLFHIFNVKFSWKVFVAPSCVSYKAFQSATMLERTQ